MSIPSFSLFPPSWLKRICIVAYESCLSEGDLLRLTADMINEHEGVIEPEGGRTKTGVRQVSPITPAIRNVLTLYPHPECRRGKHLQKNGYDVVT